MRSVEGGFTLIELIVVIVILGILAATAVPKFVSVAADARTAAAQGVAGAVASGTAINYGARSANSTNGTTVATCANAENTLVNNAFPTAEYTFSTPATAVASGATANCTVRFQPASGGSAKAVAVVTGIT